MGYNVKEVANDLMDHVLYRLTVALGILQEVVVAKIGVMEPEFNPEHMDIWLIISLPILKVQHAYFIMTWTSFQEQLPPGNSIFQFSCK